MVSPRSLCYTMSDTKRKRGQTMIRQSVIVLLLIAISLLAVWPVMAAQQAAAQRIEVDVISRAQPIGQMVWTLDPQEGLPPPLLPPLTKASVLNQSSF